MPSLVEILTSPALRDTPIQDAVRGLSVAELLRQADELENFRRGATSLYDKVRALFFLHAIHRFFLPATGHLPPSGQLPYTGYQHLLSRRFEEAIDVFLQTQSAGPGDAISSGLAAAYKELALQTLANQVRRSVRSVRGNQWMFRTGHAHDHPLRLRPELLARGTDPSGGYPLLCEKTPVRMDLTHSGWSDIFFLGMDFPAGARVLNVSIDLGVHQRDPHPRPPVEAYVRVIDEPVLRLVSVDLAARADLTELSDVFDFAKDYLGLLKAAVIAAGIVPPGLEGSGGKLSDVLLRLLGRPGLGLEVVSNVNNIPKGSRLAVSTNLLGSLIAVLMRATSQASSLTGPLTESERRTVAARAILGEWLGGSGGGWQDSGGVWPGMKVISGSLAADGDPEFGISRGRLLPTHRILTRDDASDATRQKLQDSLVLVHGGMAQNVGPILEMVTEKYLLRSQPEWDARHRAISILDEVLGHLRSGRIDQLGAATTRNFKDPIQTIIPWASNLYTETLIARTAERFGSDFWGFWMLGGMSGGGMGFIVAPHRKPEAQHFLQDTMSDTKRRLQSALPFAMEPVVYDFAINEQGTVAALLNGIQPGPPTHPGRAPQPTDNLLPPAYYAFMGPIWARTDPRHLTPERRHELNRFAAACRTRPELSGMVQTLFDRLFPESRSLDASGKSLSELLSELGFDHEQHERIRQDLRNARIGLAQNRLPVSTTIEDVLPGDIRRAADLTPDHRKLGEAALAGGQVAVFTLAAGAGSRWTQGAGVVKALHPFCRFAGTYRSFLEVHLAKSRRTAAAFGTPPAHIVATSYLTHAAIADYLQQHHNHQYPGPLLLSPGRSIGLRMVPTVRDLRFAWEETAHMVLDEQKQKVRESAQSALAGWARSAGEAADYTDNLPAQCLHPVGHFYELPNMLRNGTLRELLRQRPQLKHLMLHNIDTTGADLDPLLLGAHIASGSALTFEVIQRRLEDRGGGLARVNGRPRLVEGLAMPREEQEFSLSYYNSMTTWIDLDRFLAALGLSRSDIESGDEVRIASAVRDLAARIPTYITLKDVKKRWGFGQEDTFPVSQFEKLWSDLSALPDLQTSYLLVPRTRGQQLKDQAQLDGYVRDGSASYVESLCEFV
jgi:hypothetical protein